MNASKGHRTPILLAAALGAAATTLAACGGSAAAPPVGAPPASGHTAVERAATLNWLAMTNQMWTRGDFAALDRVTVGEARTIYQDRATAHRQDTMPARPAGRRSGSPACRSRCRATVGVNPGSRIRGQRPRCCRSQWCGSVFVAYGDTDVFTLGQSMRPEAMVFRAGRRGVEAGRGGERIFRRPPAPVACAVPRPERARPPPRCWPRRITGRRWPGRWTTPRPARPRRPGRQRPSR